jgi:hypothetical protein
MTGSALSFEEGPGDDAPRFPYRGRAIAVFAVAFVFGPLVAWLVLIGADWLTLAHEAGGIPEYPFGGQMHPLLATTYVLGSPITLRSATIISLIVGKRGNISYLKTALIVFLIPIALLSMFGPALGILFGTMYGIPAVVSALFLQFVGTFIARLFFGVRV